MSLIGNQNIIKYTYHRSGTWANRSSTTWGEPTTDWRISVTTARSDSHVVLKYFFQAQSISEHILGQYRIYNVTDSSVPDEPNANNNRARSHCPSRGQYNGDNARIITMAASLPSWSGTKIFTVQMKSDGGSLIRNLHSLGNTDPEVHWSGHLWAEAMEMEDV
jgi:hypothetical protein